jgi:hypothetical protein
VAKPDDGLVQVIREGIRDTVRDRLRAVVHEATAQELRVALREEDIRKNIVELVRYELEIAVQELQSKGRRV